jgi:hypothetical protein
MGFGTGREITVFDRMMATPSFFVRRTSWLALALLALATFSASGKAPVLFDGLPEAVRKQVLTGAPRTSGDIPESSFGVHTTLMQERNRADIVYQDELIQAIDDAGYKWVVDYISTLPVEGLSLEEIPAKMEELIPPMVEYARTLKDHGVKLLIRVDVPRWKLGPKEMPTDEDKARTRAWLEPIVRALSPYVDHWQYHNEPNYPDPRHTTPHTPPEVYVAYLAFVGEIIREIQPNAVYSGPALVMLQAMDEKPYPWLRLAFEAGLAEHIDQFSYHPYRMPWTADILPERASEFFGKWGSYYSQVADLKAMVRKYNDGKDLPLIRTETDAAGMKPGGMEGLYVQTYTKKHKDFDELLVFFWAAEQADDTHSRRKATLTLGDPTWSAPLEINLMAMPDPRMAKKQAERDDLINPENPERVQPKPLNYRIDDNGITLPDIEVRDYPMLIKWVRLREE